MTANLELVFDCADADAQATFWAAALVCEGNDFC